MNTPAPRFLRFLLSLALGLLGLSLAAPVTLTPVGNKDTLLLLSDGPLRYTAHDGVLLVYEGKLAAGATLPLGMEPSDGEGGLTVRLPEPYRVTLSADERRLTLTRAGYLQALADTNKSGDPLQTDNRAPMIFALANATPDAVAAQLSALYANLKIVVDPRQRSLLVVANPEDKPLLEAVVKYLDTPRPQVSFEAEVLEINRTATENLGIHYDFLFNLGIKEANIPTPTGNQPLRFGTFGRDTAQGLGISATINLLQSSGAGHVLARPRVTTLDGLEARINATQNTPLVVSNTNVATVQNITTGITLTMLPRVAPDGSVEVKVSISVSSPTGVTSQGVPTFSSREASTTVRVKSGEPIVIGGLLEKRNISGQEKVPGLGDIPLLGELFKNTTTNTSDTDLVIIITPRLLTPSDMTLPEVPGPAVPATPTPQIQTPTPQAPVVKDPSSPTPPPDDSRGKATDR